MTGVELKKRRMAMNLTQAELARLLGWSAQQISNLETERQAIDNPTMLNLALSYLEMTTYNNASVIARLEQMIVESRAALENSRQRVRKSA